MAVIDVAVKAVAAVLALLLPHPSRAEQNISHQRPWGEAAHLQHTEEHPDKCQWATVIYLPIMFHDYYYARSFTVMYRVESSAVSDGSNIQVKCWVFDANHPTFDLVPLKLETNWMTLRILKKKTHWVLQIMHAARCQCISYFAQTNTDSIRS